MPQFGAFASVADVRFAVVAVAFRFVLAGCPLSDLGFRDLLTLDFRQVLFGFHSSAIVAFGRRRCRCPPRCPLLQRSADGGLLRRPPCRQPQFTRSTERVCSASRWWSSSRMESNKFHGAGLLPSKGRELTGFLSNSNRGGEARGCSSISIQAPVVCFARCYRAESASRLCPSTSVFTADYDTQENCTDDILRKCGAFAKIDFRRFQRIPGNILLSRELSFPQDIFLRCFFPPASAAATSTARKMFRVCVRPSRLCLF